MSIRSSHKEQIGILIVFIGILLFFAFLPTTSNFYNSMPINSNENIIGQAYQSLIEDSEIEKEIIEDTQESSQTSITQTSQQSQTSEIINTKQYLLEGIQLEQDFFKNGYYGIQFESFSSKGGISLDFDYDGDEDFIVYGDSLNYLFLNNLNKEETKTQMLEKNEPGFVQLKIFNEQELSKQHTEVILANDFNNDGLIDFFVGNYGGDSFIYYGKEKLSQIKLQEKIEDKKELDDFKEEFNEVLIFSQRYIKSAEIYDFNNDGLDDLVVANYNQPNEIYLNDGETFKKQEGQVLNLKSTGDYSYDVKIQDLNGDGERDVLFGTNEGVYMFFNQDGTYSLDDFHKIDIKNIRKLTFADLNNDGKEDLIVSVYSGRDEYYLKTDGEEIYELFLLSEKKNTLDIINFEEENNFLTIVYDDSPQITKLQSNVLNYTPLNIEKGFFNSALFGDFDLDGKQDVLLFSDKEDKLVFGPFNQ